MEMHLRVARKLIAAVGAMLGLAVSLAVTAVPGGPPAAHASVSDTESFSDIEITVEAAGNDRMHEGQRLTYDITVHNSGENTYADAVIVQMLPVGFNVVSVEPQGDQEASGVRWISDLPAGATQEFSVVAVAGSEDRSGAASQARPVVQPEQIDTAATGRFTSTVCVRRASGSMLGCATDAAVLRKVSDDGWSMPFMMGVGLALFGAVVLSGLGAQVAWRRFAR